MARHLGRVLGRRASEHLAPWAAAAARRAALDPFAQPPELHEGLEPEDADWESAPLRAGPPTRTAPRRRAVSQVPPPLPSHGVFVSAGRVLELARAGRRPWGRPVGATGEHPSGIAVYGAAGLGLGIADGDILAQVDGLPVSHVGEVIGLVLSARVARRGSMAGVLWRGSVSYPLTVAQPYPEVLPGNQEPTEPAHAAPEPSSANRPRDARERLEQSERE